MRYIYTSELAYAADEISRTIYRYDTKYKTKCEVSDPSLTGVTPKDDIWTIESILDRVSNWSPVVLLETDSLDNEIEVLYA